MRSSCQALSSNRPSTAVTRPPRLVRVEWRRCPANSAGFPGRLRIERAFESSAGYRRAFSFRSRGGVCQPPHRAVNCGGCSMARRIPAGTGIPEASVMPLSGSVRLRIEPDRNTSCSDDCASCLGTSGLLDANAQRQDPQMNALATNRLVLPACAAAERVERGLSIVKWHAAAEASRCSAIGSNCYASRSRRRGTATGRCRGRTRESRERKRRSEKRCSEELFE